MVSHDQNRVHAEIVVTGERTAANERTFAAIERLNPIIAGIVEAPVGRDSAAVVDALESAMELEKVIRDQGRDDETFVALITESARLLRERRPRGSGLTTERAKYLVDSGAYTPEQLARAEEAVSRGALARMEHETRLGDIVGSLSTAEVARLLDIDASRVRHRQAAGLLSSFLVGQKRRYPAWQFVDGEQKLVPHLAALVEFFTASGVHHSTVEGMMTTPQDTLVVDSRSHDQPDAWMTPVAWLVGGNDPREVIDLFESYLAA